MDKNKATTSKTNGPVCKKEANDDELDRLSNNTEPFSFDQFKSSSLTERYSVHQNDAALEADFRRILADDSDIEMIDSSHKSPDKSSSGGNVSSLDKTPNKRRSIPSKDDYVLSWAESIRNQSQSLSMVASIISDHDYLSQENTLGIMTSLEESHQNQYAKDQAGYLPADETNDLKSTMQKLFVCKDPKQCCNLLNEIQQKTRTMKCHLGESSDEQRDSGSDYIYSRDHSEPMEYYGNTQFPSETPTEQSDESGEFIEIFEVFEF